MMKFFYLSTLIAIATLTSSEARAQFVCGSTNVFEKSVSWFRDFTQNFGFASSLGKKEIQCGLPGEDFKICRQCSTVLSSKQMDVIRPMLTASKYRQWLQRWHKEMSSGFVSVSSRDFDAETEMEHVRPGETVSTFERRISLNWGESFLFLHREIFKMVQFEMTLMAQPCLAPLDKLPTQWNDPAWPAPKGPEQQTSIAKIQNEISFAEKPQELKKMSLNELGMRLQKIAKSLYAIYEDPAEISNPKCAGEERVSQTCDRLSSPLSAQVHKNFWMIHAYLDSVVGKWLAAQEPPFQEISKNCQGLRHCFQWNGTYTATYPF